MYSILHRLTGETHLNNLDRRIQDNKICIKAAYAERIKRD